MSVKFKILVMPLIVFFMMINFAYAEFDFDKIMSLRQEIESLSLDLENLKKKQQGEMDVYIQNDQVLDGQILSENLKSSQFEKQIQTLKSKQVVHVSAVKNGQFLTEFWKQYEISLKSAFPLYSKKLQDKLTKIRLALLERKISYEQALLQTWFLLEEDLKKSQETDFIMAPLQIKNKDQKNELIYAEIVRLGRNRSYLRTADGRYGSLLYRNEAWSLDYFTEESQTKAISELISQYKKQLKTGIYRLPGILL